MEQESVGVERVQAPVRPLVWSVPQDHRGSTANQQVLRLGAAKIRLDWEEPLIYLARATAETTYGRGFSGVPGYAGLML